MAPNAAKRDLTDRTLKALKPAKSGTRYDVFDAEVRGLGVRVTGNGTKTFVLLTRFPGSDNPTRRALGEYGSSLTLEKAREKARDWKALIKQGIDPADEVERIKKDNERRTENSFRAVAEGYIDYQKKEGRRKAKDTEREIAKYLLEPWGALPISEISSQDVRSLILAVSNRGAKTQAHNLFALVRSLFNWAITVGYPDIQHPLNNVKPKILIGARRVGQRVLDDDEIAALWRVADRLEYPAGSFLRLLMLTAQRRSDVANSSWPEFNLAERLWTIPPERFKTNQTQMVPLSDAAMSVIKSLPRYGGEGEDGFVLSTSVGKRPISAFSQMKKRIDAMMVEELGRVPKDWHFHDIRRTVRTKFSSLKVLDEVSEMAIGHGPKGIKKVYNLHKYLPEIREAMDRWAGKLRDIVTPAPANVISIESARA